MILISSKHSELIFEFTQHFTHFNRGEILVYLLIPGAWFRVETKYSNKAEFNRDINCQNR